MNRISLKVVPVVVAVVVEPMVLMAVTEEAVVVQSTFLPLGPLALKVMCLPKAPTG